MWDMSCSLVARSLQQRWYSKASFIRLHTSTQNIKRRLIQYTIMCVYSLNCGNIFVVVFLLLAYLTLCTIPLQINNELHSGKDMIRDQAKGIS